MTGEPAGPADNRANWDHLTPIHAASSFYNVAGFLSGESTLKAFERRLVGDVDGHRLLHLQCHFGLDTLSWARLGARVTGVDFSSVAIETARKLSAEAGLPATFLCADVQALPVFADPFDVAVTTYGVLCWIGDLDLWARGVAIALRRGGRFVLVDYHPVLEAVHPGKMTGAGGYFGHEPAEVTTTGTYAAPEADVTYRERRWQHTVGEVVSALVEGGLAVTAVEEHPESAFPLFEGLAPGSDGLWHPSDDDAAWPHTLAVVAERVR